MNRRRLIIGAGLVVIIVIILVFIQSSQLHLVSSTPANGAKDFTPSSNLVFKFSKDMDPAIAGRISGTPKISGNATVSGAVLTFTPTVSLQASTTYTVTIADPTDTTGHQMRTVAITFTTGFAEFNSLSKTQQKSATDSTDLIQKTHPVTQYLPQTTLDYTITFKTDSSGTISYPVTLNVVPRYANDPTYIPALRKAQAEVLTWLKSVGADPSTMNIIYNPDPNTGVFTPDN